MQMKEPQDQSFVEEVGHPIQISCVTSSVHEAVIREFLESYGAVSVS